jgi:hypothetical protein
MWIILLILGIYAAILTIGSIVESIEWNGGKCPKCGKEWKLFDVDSQGGRGYTCDCRHIWISYPVDRNYKNK